MNSRTGAEAAEPPTLRAEGSKKEQNHSIWIFLREHRCLEQPFCTALVGPEPRADLSAARSLPSGAAAMPAAILFLGLLIAAPRAAVAAGTAANAAHTEGQGAEDIEQCQRRGSSRALSSLVSAADASSPVSTAPKKLRGVGSDGIWLAARIMGACAAQCRGHACKNPCRAGSA